MRLAAEQPFVGAEREQEREPVRHDQNSRDPLGQVQLGGPGRRLGMQRVEERREDQSDDRERQHRGAHPGGGAVEPDLRAAEARGDERQAQDEEQVAQDAAGNGCLDQIHEAGAQRHDRDDELRRVAERRVEQSADGGSGLGREVLGGLAHVAGERQHAEAGEDEDQHSGIDRARRAPRWPGRRGAAGGARRSGVRPAQSRERQLAGWSLAPPRGRPHAAGSRLPARGELPAHRLERPGGGHPVVAQQSGRVAPRGSSSAAAARCSAESPLPCRRASRVASSMSRFACEVYGQIAAAAAAADARGRPLRPRLRAARAPRRPECPAQRTPRPSADHRAG